MGQPGNDGGIEIRHDGVEWVTVLRGSRSECGADLSRSSGAAHRERGHFFHIARNTVHGSVAVAPEFIRRPVARAGLICVDGVFHLVQHSQSGDVDGQPGDDSVILAS